MQRGIWITVFLISLALAAKLALKPPGTPLAGNPGRAGERDLTSPTEDAAADQPTSRFEPVDAALLNRYPDTRDFVARVIGTFGHNARRIEATEGIEGLRLLDEMGDIAVCLHEERPDEFHRLAQLAASDADAVKLVGAWRLVFDPAQYQQEVTARLAMELSKLSGPARRLAERTPEALPFLLTDSRSVTELLDRFGPAALEPLAFVDLSDGGRSLRRASTVIEQYGALALEANERLGPAGFLLIERYGALVDAIQGELGLPRALTIVAAASDDLYILSRVYRTRTIADAILHLHSRGLLDIAAGAPHALRLAVEFGSDGERVLQLAGPHAAHVVYETYLEGRCRNSVVQAIAQGGLPAAAAAEKQGVTQEFRTIVERDGAGAILAVASAVSAEETRQFLAAKEKRSWTESLALTALRMAGDSSDKTIRMIDRDGLDRVENLANGSVKLYQFFPLYDLSHLAAIATQGYLPTRGEFVWAGMDAALVAVDVVSLLSLQPEGVAASEATRTGVHSATRVGVQTGSHAMEQVAETVSHRALASATRQFSRSTTEQLGERAATLGTQAAESASMELAQSLARRSSIRLVRWDSATRRLLLGHLSGLPSSRLTKYVAANAGQAAVGLVAVRKMEEYLEGRGAGDRQ
jgi:hypothetical protein